MDKVAVISDIHGNIPALNAVLEDIQKRQITQIICLGDLVGKGPHSSQSVDISRQKCDVVVQGNWDDFITNATDSETLKWHQKQLRGDQKEYLKSLPFSYELYMSGKYIRMFHASPRSLYERIQPWHSLEDRLSMFSNSEQTKNLFGDREPDVVGYGDVHNAYLQHINGKTLFNAGSVGNPLDITQASYVILEGTIGADNDDKFSIQFQRVPYNIQEAIQLAEKENMPELQEYIDELTTAVYRGLKK